MQPRREGIGANWWNENKPIVFSTYCAHCIMDGVWCVRIRMHSHFVFIIHISIHTLYSHWEHWSQRMNTKFNWIKSTGMRLWLIHLSLHNPFPFAVEINLHSLRWHQWILASLQTEQVQPMPEMIATCGSIHYFVCRLQFLFCYGVVGFCFDWCETMRESHANNKSFLFRENVEWKLFEWNKKCAPAWCKIRHSSVAVPRK